MGKRVFVSYSRFDARIVDTIVADLGSLGHQPWVDRQILGGQRWWNEILAGIEACEIFLIGLSPAALDSAACRAEYRYATALAKPVLPVAVRHGITDSLLPEGLAAVNRIDYTTEDKNAFSQLLRGLSSLPAPPPLPNPMPPRPKIPETYLYDLKEEIDSDEPLPSAKQEHILKQLTARLQQGSDPGATRELLQRMQRRDDLLVRTSQRIGELLSTLPPTHAPMVGAPAITNPVPGYPQRMPPVEVLPPPVATSGRSPGTDTPKVSPAWWLVPIVFGLIGGVVAWFVNKDQAPGTARNMVIVGAISSVVWYFIFAGG